MPTAQWRASLERDGFGIPSGLSRASRHYCCPPSKAEAYNVDSHVEHNASLNVYTLETKHFNYTLQTNEPHASIQARIRTYTHGLCLDDELACEICVTMTVAIHVSVCT
jgi:hypothetical protein